jgi:hypothetical protein
MKLEISIRRIFRDDREKPAEAFGSSCAPRLNFTRFAGNKFLLLFPGDSMNNALTRCPVCQNELTITRLRCESCDTSLEGRFSGGPFAHMTREQMDFIMTFIRCEGKLNRVEIELGLSYPTLRNRLHDIIRALGYEPGKEETPDMAEDRRRQVLEDLDTGKLTADAAMRMLRGEEV